MNNTDPSGFDCMGSSECGYEYSQQAMAGAMAVAAATQAQLRAADPGSATGAYTAAQIAGLSNAASNAAGADVQAQNQARMAEEASQASARAREQVQAQNRTNQDAQRAHDATFMNPYTAPLQTPETGNGLYYGPPMGANWTGYVAENGSGGGGNQRSDAGSNGTSANGGPLPYVEQHPAWFQIAAGMCLLPEFKAAVNLWELANKLESDAPPILSKEAERGISSLEKQIAAHEQKLAEFKANPTVRPGMEKLPREVIERQQQIRIQHLEREIQTFKNNIEKLRSGGQ